MRDLLPKLKRLRVLSLPYFLVKADQLFDTMGKLKHLRYLNLERASIKELPKVVAIAYNLQSLILEGCRELVELPDSIDNLKHLRYANLRYTTIKQLPASMGDLYDLQTLILQGCGEFVELPDTIGSLKSLRYLTLEGCDKIKRLPDSMSDLYNLQTLILQECYSLMELPAGMERLINLCHLDIQYTNLSEMPPGMGNLTKLKKLVDFFIGKQSGSSIKELGKLQHLQGTLRIRNLENVVNAQDAAEADLKGKKQLERLVLKWNGDDTDDSQQERNVLEKLEPDPNLKHLEIYDYGGTKLPDWMGLVQLTAGHSTSPKEIDVGGHNLVSPCAHQGPIGNLTCLSELTFFNCPNILNFPRGGLPAPNLKRLRLSNCGQLKWLPERMHFLLPSLDVLRIEGCPEVESFPEGGLPSKLQSLRISNCNKLIAGHMQWNLQSHPSLSEFTIGNNEEVESFLKNTLLPSTLTSLQIWRLKKLKALNEGIQQLTSLKTLRITYWPLISHIPSIWIGSKEINRAKARVSLLSLLPPN